MTQAQEAISNTRSPGQAAPQNTDLYNRYGPWAVVTGASEGIGRAFARALAEAGVNLVLVARRRDVLQQLASELSARHGIESRVLDLDLGDPDAPGIVLTCTADLEAGLLVASAGFGTSGPFLDSVVEVESNMIDLNCRALMALTHGFARRFADRGRGGIVLMSSLVAFQGVPRSANYAATKAFVQSLAEGLHHELKPLGVDVLSSAPGPIRSGFAARAGMELGNVPGPEVVARETLAALGLRITVRPGFLSKFLELSLKTVPRWARVRIMAQVMKGMTRHQMDRGDDGEEVETRQSA
jgi:short-subunit dehydrogenase